jgi:hypothetical protein
MPEFKSIDMVLKDFRDDAAHIPTLEKVHATYKPIMKEPEKKIAQFHKAHVAMIKWIYKESKKYPHFVKFLNDHIDARELEQG